MNIINPYRFDGATGLLADYSGAAAAFSLRQLISTWTGAVVEVRRSSDNATADFTAAEVANGTMTTWVGASNGAVRTWYDQSGNGFDLTQTASNPEQPKIILGGSVVTVNGEPALDFNGAAQYLQNAGSIPYNGGLSWYAVTDFDSIAAESSPRLWSDDITGVQGYCLFYLKGISGYSVNDNNTGYNVLSTADHSVLQELSSYNFDDSTSVYQWARNGSNTTSTLAGWTGPIDSSNTSNVGVMGSGDGQQLADGKLQELIIYPNYQGANRTGIESNINAYYSIY